MLDTISAMLSDRLWIYTAIAGALLGAAFLVWFKGTRAGLWCYSKFDQLLDYLVQRWNWTWLAEDPEAWRKRYPKVTAKIDDLEARLAKLENKKK